jgi:hypothetical protein
MPDLTTAWTPDELAANRRGELAPSQLAKIRNRPRVILAIFAVPMIAIMSTGGWLCMRNFGPTAQLAMAIAMALCVVGTLVAIVRIAHRPFRNNPTRVVPLTGVLDASLGVDAEGNTKTVYSIGGQQLRPVYAGLAAFRGQTVTVYKLPDDPAVIAVES